MPEVMIDNNCCHYAHFPACPGKGTGGGVRARLRRGRHCLVISAEQAEQSLPVIVPDLPGHGRSAGLPLDSAPAYAALLEKFRCALNLDTFFLLGHPFGGAVVQEYTRSNPHRVRGMVLVGTGTRFMMSRMYREL